MLGAKEIKSLDALEDFLSERQLDTQIHNILKNQISNTASRLKRLWFHPKRKFKFNIPLCRMISLLVVRLFFKNDVINFANHFVSYEFLKGNDVFYVVIKKTEGKTMKVTSDIIST